MQSCRKCCTPVCMFLFAANTVITIAPLNTVGLINSTASLLCEASFPPSVDNVYLWRFNGRDIDFTNHPHYRQVSDVKKYGPSQV